MAQACFAVGALTGRGDRRGSRLIAGLEAFASGYVPSSDGRLTRSEVISACLRGIRRS
jgi:hypothetical protein